MAGPLVVITCSLGAPWESDFVRAAAHPALGVHVGARCGDPGHALGMAMRDEPFAIVADSIPGWWDRDMVARLAEVGTALVVVGGPAPTGAVQSAGESSDAIATALLRLDARAEPAVAAEVGPSVDRGDIIAVWGGAGAPGRSTVAIHLAAAAAKRRAGVLLVDADVHAPSIAQRLDLDDARGLVHAARAAAADGDPFARTIAAAHGFTVLPGLARPELWPEVGEASFDALIDAVVERFGLAVVDLASSIEEDEALSFDRVPFRRNLVTRAALGRASCVVLVVAGDPIGVRRAIHAHEALRREMPSAADRVEIVVNRVPAARVAEVEAAIAGHLGLPVAASITVDRGADPALWSGGLTTDVSRRSPIWNEAMRIAARWAA